MYDINSHISRELNNEFSGSERKKTVELDGVIGEKYLLKLSDPMREKHSAISYINNAVSEYIGCHIAEMLGMSVQQTKLGLYTYSSLHGEEKTRLACLCKDVRINGEQLIHAETIELSDYDARTDLCFESINAIIRKIKGISQKNLEDFYYDMFVLDAFIGNTDRHNGNWGILQNSDGVRISPIYDCGSCLLPLLSDEKISSGNLNNLYLSVCSAITDNGSRINYTEYLTRTENRRVDNAIKRIFPRIDLTQINSFIDGIDLISVERKNMYKDFLQTRYQKILIPALKRIFEYDGVKPTTTLTKDELYSFYKENLEAVAAMKLFEKKECIIHKRKYCLMKVSNGLAVFIKNERCDGILPIHSNDDSVRKAISIIKKKNDERKDLSKE